MAATLNPSQRRILYIIGSTSSTKNHPEFSVTDTLLTLPFEAVTAAALSNFAPDLVVFPLFSGALDATDVLTALDGFGYGGRCLVLAESLPRPKLIEAELRGYAGRMHVELILTGLEKP